MERITGMDAAFLEVESPSMHLHVVGAVVLDPTRLGGRFEPGRLTDLFLQRLGRIPPFRKRLVTVPGGLDHPRWIEDPDFDLRRHLHHRRLGPDATVADLEEFVGEVAGVQIDRRRPLWEVWLVDGFADGTVALVSKIHHSLMDGAASGDVMASLFDLDPDPPTEAAVVSPHGELPPHATELLWAAGPSALRRTAGVPSVVARTVRGLVESARDVAAAPESLAGLAPRSLFNGALTPARSVAFRRCRLDDLKSVRSAYGTTVNDVVLAATTWAVRNYLIDREVLPHRPMVASVPVAGDGAGRHQADGFGNHTSNMMVPLPVHLHDPVDALIAIHSRTVGAKAAHHALEPDVLDDWVTLLPPLVISAGARAYAGLGLGRFHPPLFNAIVSNVAGPPVPLYLAGARVTAIYPMGPLIGNTGLNLTVLSRTDELDVGLMACPDLVEDVGELADGFVDGVAQLRAAAARRSGVGHRG